MSNTPYLRWITMLVVALLISATGALLPGPQADAVETDANEAGETIRFSTPRLSSSCRDGYTTYPSGITYRDLPNGPVYCVESGFTTITTESLCAEAATNVRLAGWQADYEVCVYSQVGSRICPPPLFPFQWTGRSTGTVYDGCFIPVMSNAAAVARIDAIDEPPATPVCIESKIVQSHDSVSTLNVGTTFRGMDDGIRYIITTGGDCAFGCVDGFDANCDGKLGDFCAVELDRHKASDVATCLATRRSNDLTSVQG